MPNTLFYSRKQYQGSFLFFHYSFVQFTQNCVIRMNCFNTRYKLCPFSFTYTVKFVISATSRAGIFDVLDIRLYIMCILVFTATSRTHHASHSLFITIYITLSIHKLKKKKKKKKKGQKFGKGGGFLLLK